MFVLCMSCQLSLSEYLLLKCIISPAKEYCKATFTFEATNEDELALKEGDIVCILNKVQFHTHIKVMK